MEEENHRTWRPRGRESLGLSVEQKGVLLLHIVQVESSMSGKGAGVTVSI